MGACLNETSEGRIRRKLNVGDHKLFKQQIIANGAYGDIWKCKNQDG